MSVYFQMRQHLRTPKIIVCNKIDRINEKLTVYAEQGFFPKRAFIVKHDGTGLHGYPTDVLNYSQLLELIEKH